MKGVGYTCWDSSDDCNGASKLEWGEAEGGDGQTTNELVIKAAGDYGENNPSATCELYGIWENNWDPLAIRMVEAECLKGGEQNISI